jgi:hypothetical protein
MADQRADGERAPTKRSRWSATAPGWSRGENVRAPSIQTSSLPGIESGDAHGVGRREHQVVGRPRDQRRWRIVAQRKGGVDRGP